MKKGLKFLKARREELGLSRYEVSKKTGILEETLKYYEDQGGFKMLSNLAKLRRVYYRSWGAFGKAIDSFLKGCGK